MKVILLTISGLVRTKGLWCLKQGQKTTVARDLTGINCSLTEGFISNLILLNGK